MNLLKIVLSAGVLLIAAAMAPWAFAQTSSSDQSATSSQQGSSDATVLVDPAKIYNENPMSWVGKQVVLQNVTVQDTNNSGNFWVGSDNDHRMLVVKEEGNATLKVMELHKGDVVIISGKVEAASRYKAETTSAESGSMHDAQKTTGVFLLAHEITVSSSTHK